VSSWFLFTNGTYRSLAFNQDPISNVLGQSVMRYGAMERIYELVQ
jgi:hypothetical protein